MLYMVEMDLSDRAREHEWNDWYAAHLTKLLSMPGFRSAQRFKALPPALSPYLAIYDIDSASVLASNAYRSGGGPSSPGEWTSIMVDWHRNLFDCGQAPAVPLSAYLVVVDRKALSEPPLPIGVSALRCVGLDRIVFERGIAVCSAEEARAWQASSLHHTRVFQPLTGKLRAGGVILPPEENV